MKSSQVMVSCCCVAILLGTPVENFASESLVIENISVYDVSSSVVRSNQTIVIVDHLITQVGATPTIRVPNDATVIPGNGLTAMPGLTDAHVHMNEIDTGTFLANGVTSVRELNGSAKHLKLRDDIASGGVLGPRLLVSSPLISGRSMQYRHLLVETPAQAKQLVEELFSTGYDYLKIYDDLSESTYLQLVATAKELKMKFVGHIPSAVGLEGVLNAGQSIEHNEKIVAEVLRSNYSDFEPLRAAADLISNAGVTVTPTLAVHEFLSDRQSDQVLSRLSSDELAYVNEDILGWWNSTFPGPGQDDGDHSDAQDFLNAQRFLLVELARRGVPIMAGTDTPNPLMIAGFGLHDELDALVRAGLSIEDAIRAATLVPGVQMPWPVQIGEVKVGYEADLLLVRGNPSDDISTLRNPIGVISNGKWLDRSQLDRLLTAARRR
jgi:hypothetical protein